MAETSSIQKPAEEKPNAVEHYLKDKTWVENPELLPWYTKDLVELEPKTRELFETYSKVPSDEVVPHIKSIRDKAFKIFPYPCLGHWGFLNLSIQKSSSYDEVLQRIKSGERYLDIGCCVGQDIRKLVYDGAPSENTYSSDLKGQFWDIGFDLFLDKPSLRTTFIEADVFDDKSGLQQLAGKIDIVHAASFFHLFQWDGQVAAAKKIIALLNPASENLIVGRQAGRSEAGDFNTQDEQTKRGYWHDLESWAKLWKQVGEETGTKWNVEASFDEQVDLFQKSGGKTDFMPEGTKFMRFVIRRV